MKTATDTTLSKARGKCMMNTLNDNQDKAWLVALHRLATGVTWATILVTASLALEFDLGIPRLLVAAIGGFLGFAFLAAGEGIILLLWKLLGALSARLGLARGVQLLELLPPVPIGRLLAAFVFIAGDVLWPNSFLQSIVLPVVGEIAIVLAGLTVMLIALARMNGRSRPAQLALVGPPILLTLAFVVWVVNPGFDNYVAAVPETAVTTTTPLTIADPGQPGPYAVQSLSYGNGQNRHRPEFGDNAALITPVVDGSALFGGYSGLSDTYYQWYWEGSTC
jgi:hypothetical protein